MLLSVENVDVSYGSARVLSSISLSVDQGEMVFVVGRNGAGKTTLLKTVAGFLVPTNGTIRLSGDPIAGVPAEQLALKGIRYVFSQGHSVRFPG